MCIRRFQWGTVLETKITALNAKIDEQSATITALNSVRIGEIKALKWSDVDFENKRVYIHRSMVQTEVNGVYRERCVDRTKGKKKECNRYMNLSDLAISILKEQRKETAFFEYVFMTNDHPLQTNIPLTKSVSGRSRRCITRIFPHMSFNTRQGILTSPRQIITNALQKFR